MLSESVQLPTYADNVALPAFPAAAAAVNQYFLPPGAQQQTCSSVYVAPRRDKCLDLAVWQCR